MTLRLENYDMLTGAFDINSVAFTKDITTRYVDIKACQAGKEKSDASFRIFIYERDCTEAAYIDYTAEHKIVVYPQVDQFATDL